MGNGNIVKISNGTIKEASKGDYVVSAKNIHTNAGQKIVENSKDGVVYGEPKKFKVKDDLADITVGMFFDGTGNNRKNVEIREKHREQHTDFSKEIGYEHKWEDHTSYDNAPTNVDNLEKTYPKLTLYFSIYTEGIGTTNEKYDLTIEKASGAGGTGIRGKVRKACTELVNELKKRTKKDINTLTIDVFGFSRGAAAARNFVHEVTKGAYPALHPQNISQNSINTDNSHPDYTDSDGEKVAIKDLPARGHFGLELLNKGRKVNKVIIRLAGLFDTVASYGLIAHDNTQELHLNAVNQASKIVHLTASDEHRDKFPLTSVTTGIELSLPGVHSDIGGSYPDNIKEHVSLAEELLSIFNREELIKRERERLIEQGWYKSDQMKVENGYKLTGDRTISNKYSMIPLNLMCQLCKDTVKFNDIKLQQQFSIETSPLENSTLKLTEVYNRLLEYAVNKTSPSLVFNDSRQLNSLRKMVENSAYSASKFEKDKKDHKMLFELRNRYLHFSSSWDGIGMEPHINTDGDRERITYPKYKL